MTSGKKTVKPWGGRFNQRTDPLVERFTQSVSFDQRLAACDIQASIAHVTMLAQVDVITKAECAQIKDGLIGILKDIQAGTFQWQATLEDVHMNIEAALIDKIGEVGKKVHTARSRNDQIATDMRLFLREEVSAILSLLVENMSALLALAEREADTLLPGLTHLQGAQPVSFGHHLMAWYEMLKRDQQRLQDALQRINVMPLGAVALAGTGFPVDRAYTAQLLGFPTVSQNSLDAVSDRDFIIEFCACASLIMMHLSRFSEELVLWVSPQFNFIEIADAFCTGSSIMPQKKNPDVPELVRGKTGRVYGDLMAMLTLMKAQPLAYNRDNQEDKECLFDAVDTVKQCLQVYVRLLPSIKVNREKMRSATGKGFLTATDLADYLVLKGVAFRDAHEIVGQVVRHAVKERCELHEIALTALQKYSEKIAEDVYGFLEPSGSIFARDHIGGTAPDEVRRAIAKAKAYLSTFHSS